ncbi:NTP transferase domain-containing protein [Elioraea sp.]|uniref:NTP transferase domain-containing protein n=1 Tax=Elioraea sp. TaxID=2185103 RepID=UPI003F6E5BCA
MTFGEEAVEDAAGAILAHSVKAGGRMLKKGRVLTREDALALASAGIARVIVARLETDDVAEDEAADRLADACLGPLLARTRAATGRVNLSAGTHGLLLLDRARIERLNRLDEAVTLATLPPWSVVQPRDMVATVKIIPFAVDRRIVAAAAAIARQGGPLLEVRPFTGREVGLVLTRLAATKESVLDGTVEATRDRVVALGAELLPEERCNHDTAEVAAALKRLKDAGARILLIAGASAVVDRRDVCPAAILRAGGTIHHFGMPVDPGNLLCFGAIDGIPAVVLPGGARRPKLNGVEWVLQRRMADLPLGARDIMDMGVGGLLKEIELRPLPRARAPDEDQGPAPKRGSRIAALVLAAGRSRRMAPLNKLLVKDRTGKTMIARVVDNVLASRARPVIVVTGHEAEAVRAALPGREVVFVHNPDYAQGLSSSLRAGVDALPPDVDAALVCLGDMPLVTAPMLDRLMAAFDPDEGREIVMPTFRGKQGNPMLWGRRFFAAVRGVTGDVGARHLAGEHAEAVHEVEMADDAVMRDFDTTEALAGDPRAAKG